MLTALGAVALTSMVMSGIGVAVSNVARVYMACVMVSAEVGEVGQVRNVADVRRVSGCVGKPAHEERDERIRSAQHQAGPKEDIQRVHRIPPERMITLSLRTEAVFFDSLCRRPL